MMLTFVNSENVGRLNACGSTVAVQLTAAVLALFYTTRRVAGPTGGWSANKKIAQRTKSFFSLILYSTPTPLFLYMAHGDSSYWESNIPMAFTSEIFCIAVDFILVVILLCCPPTSCSGCRAPISYANTISRHCVIFAPP
jgi:hypothetical protein